MAGQAMHSTTTTSSSQRKPSISKQHQPTNGKQPADKQAPISNGKQPRCSNSKSKTSAANQKANNKKRATGPRLVGKPNVNQWLICSLESLQPRIKFPVPKRHERPIASTLLVKKKMIAKRKMIVKQSSRQLETKHQQENALDAETGREYDRSLIEERIREKLDLMVEGRRDLLIVQKQQLKNEKERKRYAKLGYVIVKMLLAA
ncbi:hypothetical protein PHYPSEUDO_002236 [Phytophthora pseudosyringae]|uniref:Uncharacterized protein n=1 Tax=Phytophthora pseudosyringae TaxID=221518 RepID=A0A8T1VXX4_9STRA|nr:hypothetical protein PHYPSEUDO_002236 [Phytophthora pseudosyringae]